MKTCRECKIEKPVSEFYSKNADCKICSAKIKKNRYCRNKSRAQKLKYYYEMTLEQYDMMLDQQNGGCKICHRKPEDVGVLVVDHDHNCHPTPRACAGCVRGLLCQDCNIGLGKFFHNGDLLIKAKDYLVEFEGSASIAS